MKDWLVNKRLVIMGGTAGMGLSAAIAFVEEGAKVVAVGRDPEHIKNASDKLKGTGIAIEGDATDETTALKAIEACVNTFGGFDGLYHVAGGSGRKFGDGPLHEISDDGWQQTIQQNLTSVFLSNRAAVRQFIAQKTGGSIVNVSSVLAWSPSPRFFATHAYAAA